MNKIKSSFLCLAASLVACMSSCSDDEVNTDLVPTEVAFETHLHLDSSYPCFDGETRATQGRWENGDVIFVTTGDQSNSWRGKATYHADVNDWTLVSNRQLSLSEQGSCSVFYFRGGNITTDGTPVPTMVSIDEKIAIFSCTNATFSVSEDAVYLKSHLAPHTWRMAFSGAAGSEVKVKSSSDIEVYSGLNLLDGTFNTQKKDIDLSVRTSGNTDYFYAEFTAEESKVQILLDGAYNIRKVKNGNLKKGQTGILYLPSSDDKRGWSSSEYIDLGLPSGTLWATCNLGAFTPEEYGYYFAWGEIAPKAEYEWSTYQYGSGETQLTKYCTNPDYGSVDNRTRLELTDDAAYTMWGEDWCMPTRQQEQELIANTTRIWHTAGNTEHNGVIGIELRSNINGNSIFLPSAGEIHGIAPTHTGNYGNYLSRDLNSDTPSKCSYIFFGTPGKGSPNVYQVGSREVGHSIRPVRRMEETHEYIDLGLPSGTLWATCNLGAFTPEEYGYYFAWGETAPKAEYEWSTYQYGLGETQLTKYCTNPDYGTVDNKTRLELTDDAAYTMWGEDWCMPTRQQEQELIANTTRIWHTAGNTEHNGVIGIELRSNINGNSIFLPSAGEIHGIAPTHTGNYGNYLSRDLNSDTPSKCSYIFFGTPGKGGPNVYQVGSREVGHSVRPVRRMAEGTHEYVDLGLPSGLKWATCNVGASSPEEYGDYFAWGETEPKEYYDWSTYKWCDGTNTSITKYCAWSRFGKIDDKKILDPEDDAAHVNWGGTWRMPTSDEIEELCHNSSCIWTTQSGVEGLKVVGLNGNSFFLPAAGFRLGGGLYNWAETRFFGEYWTSSLSDDDDNDYAYIFELYTDGFGYGGGERYCGRSVRPVCQ